jgi:hypothetical protein
MKRILVLVCLVLFLGTFISAGYVAAAERFVNNNDGTVTDTQTNLMWADKDNSSNINWYAAQSYCEGYSGGGKTGWRMPTIDELGQLYNSGAFGNAIQRTSAYGQVWSANTSSNSAAAFFNFSTGKSGYDYMSIGKYLALPVRSGK